MMTRTQSRLRSGVATLAVVALAVGFGVSAADGERRLRLQGRASVDRRTHVVGAVVSVRPVGDLTRVYLTTTDDGGKFHIEGLPEGDYDVSFSRIGYTTVVKDNVRLKFPFRAVVEVTMPRSEDPIPDAIDHPEDETIEPIKIRGIVVHRGDAGIITEARVRFVHPEGEQNPRATETGVDGIFELSDLPSGPWEVVVDAVGFIGVTAVLDLQQDTEIALALVRQPANYTPTAFELMPPERLVPPKDFNVELVIR